MAQALDRDHLLGQGRHQTGHRRQRLHGGRRNPGQRSRQPRRTRTSRRPDPRMSGLRPHETLPASGLDVRRPGQLHPAVRIQSRLVQRHRVVRGENHVGQLPADRHGVRNRRSGIRPLHDRGVGPRLHGSRRPRLPAGRRSQGGDFEEFRHRRSHETALSRIRGHARIRLRDNRRQRAFGPGVADAHGRSGQRRPFDCRRRFQYRRNANAVRRPTSRRKQASNRST